MTEREEVSCDYGPRWESVVIVRIEKREGTPTEAVRLIGSRKGHT